jgi:hypothetical protein
VGAPTGLGGGAGAGDLEGLDRLAGAGLHGHARQGAGILVGPLVVAGAGAALLPVALAEEAAALGAEVRRLDPPIHRPVTLAHRDGPLSPAAAAVVVLATSG